MKGRKKLNPESKFCYVVLTVLTVLCILPLILLISGSLSNESTVVKEGYSLFPRNFTLDAYKFLLSSNKNMILSSYWMTIKTVVIGTIYSLTMTTLFAYALSQKKEVFRFGRQLSFIAWFTTIFSGGVLPWYILCTQHYGLKNNIWALIIPHGMSVFNMYILRGNFRNIPDELVEAAQLDGASDFKVFKSVAFPLARSGVVTISLFNILMYWNDFYLPKWLVSSQDLYTMQKLLYVMLSNVANLGEDNKGQIILDSVIPLETSQLAVAVMTIIPIAIIYPMGLKFFVKGITVGGVKG